MRRALRTVGISLGPVVAIAMCAQLPAGGPVRLSLDEAIQRGLKTNLGILQRESANRIVRADRIRALSALLPNVTGSVGGTEQQTNLAVFGFNFPGVPQIIGPFHYVDGRAFASVSVYDRAARKNLQLANQNLRTAELDTQDTRDLIVQAVANSYLAIIASGARVQASQVLVNTARALYERARDQHAAGVSPAIDELRAQVELQSRQQQLLANQNQLAKDKLVLAEVIGFPAGQDFELADAAPYTPLEGLTAEEMLDRALQNRADYQSLKAQLRAAEISRQAALARRYPTLSVNGDYGANGIDPTQLHGTFAVTGSVKFLVFDGGRVKADVAQADAVIQQRKDEIRDMENRISVAVRSALLDLKSAADQVSVARSNLDLAQQTLEQSRDRFSAGVTDNVEVVQAQNQLASAQENLIAAEYAHNLSKVALSRAVGMTETNLKQFMGAKE
jgi:outer membrane protein TolC